MAIQLASIEPNCRACEADNERVRSLVELDLRNGAICIPKSTEILYGQMVGIHSVPFVVLVALASPLAGTPEPAGGLPGL